MRAAENLIQLDAEQWNARSRLCVRGSSSFPARTGPVPRDDRKAPFTRVCVCVCVRLSTATSDFGGGPKGLSRCKLCVFFASVNICRRPRDRDREERQL